MNAFVKPKSPPIHPAHTVEEAFAFILRYHYEHLSHWVDIVVKGGSGARQTRVALRRIRSSLMLFRPAFPHEFTETLRIELKWFAGRLLLARRMDALVDALSAEESRSELKNKGAGREALRILAQKRREEAYAGAREVLTSARYHRLQAEFKHWVKGEWGGFPEAAEQAGINMKGNVCAFASSALDRRFNGMVRMGEGLEGMIGSELNALSSECRWMRYDARLFSSVFGKKRLLPVLTVLRQLQEVFVDIRQRDTISDALKMLPKLEGSAADYAQTLTLTLDGERRVAQGEQLPEIWGELVEQKRPWLAPKL